MRHAVGAVVVLVVWSLCACLASAGVKDTVGVSTDVELQHALQQPQVQHVVLLQDITFQPEPWQRDGDNDPVYVLTRNVTITSQPKFNRLDFAFLASNWLRLASGVRFNFTDTVIEQSRYGVGMQLDFVAPSAGAIVVLQNVVVVRHLCVNDADEPAAIAVMPRLPGFPGDQRAHYETNHCTAGMCVPQLLVYDDFTKLSTFTADSAAGGYAMVLRNTSKLCLGWAKYCTDSSITEACIQRALDALPSAAPTRGRLAAAADAAEAQRRQQVVVPATVGSIIGAGVLLALLLAVLRCKRRQLCLPGSKGGAILGTAPTSMQQGSPGSVDAKLHEASVLGLCQVKDVEAVIGVDSPAASASAGSQHSRGPLLSNAAAPAAAAAPAQQDQLCMQDNWELAAWKTSSHSLRRLSSAQQQQQQQQQAAADVVIGVDSGPLCTAVSFSPFGGKELTSHELILQGTGLTTQKEVVSANKITLGVCIGAGAFGRVYRGRWRGLEVAVKVVQHSQAAAVSVANEIDLMMSLHHPHLVSAYHFVTWRRRRDGTGEEGHVTNSARQVVPFVRQNSHSSGRTSGGHSFHAFHTSGLGPAEDGCPEDTQTWIVQEFCDAGNLADYSIIHGDRQDGELPTGHAMLRLLFRLREVADGMLYLHDTARVVHGDLKSSNILLCIAPTAPYGRIAKIADFGLARVYAADETHKSTRTLGTINHMAPELLRFGKSSAASDVYSFGIMAWELLTGETAFQGWQWGAILENVALHGQRPTVPEGTPEDVRLLMESCWCQEPSQRPTFAEVLRCINIMINSRQQQLATEQAKTGQHVQTLSAADSATKRADSSHQSVFNTGASTVQAEAAVTSSISSNGEFEMLRVGSMRRLSSLSNATNSSSALAMAAAGMPQAPGPGAQSSSSGRLLVKPAGQALSGSTPPAWRASHLQQHAQQLQQSLQPPQHLQQPRSPAATKQQQLGSGPQNRAIGGPDDDFGPQDL